MVKGVNTVITERSYERFFHKITETTEAGCEDRLQTLKRQIIQDNSSLLESAMKKVKKEPYTIREERNKNQNEHQEKFMQKRQLENTLEKAEEI